MKSIATLLLAGLLVLAISAASRVTAGDAPVAAPDPAKAPEPAKPATGDTTAPKTDVPTAQDLTQGLKDAKAAETTKTDTPAKDAATPKKPPTPYEQKLAKIEALQAKAKEAQAKIPAIETKINEAVSKMTDSAKKPIEPKELERELVENRPSQAAREYKKHQLTLAAAYEQVKALVLLALKDSVDLSKMTTSDEALKAKNEEIQTSLKQQCVELLSKLVIIYERIGETERVDATYRQILALDKTNGAAVAYFKEQEAKKKNPNKSSGTGGGGAYTPSRPGGYSR